MTHLFQRKRHPLVQQLISVALSTVAAALFVAVAIPHHHNDGTPSSHRAESCRACKIQEGFSAAPSPQTVLPVKAEPVAFIFPLKQSLAAQPVVFSPTGRAPPFIG